MAEVMVPSARQRVVADLRAAGVTDQEIIARLNPRGETIIIQEAPTARNNVPWIVGGSLAALAMLMSFAWSAMTSVMGTFEKMLARHHELALTAAQPAVSASVESGGNPDMAYVGALLVLAAICILIGLMRSVIRVFTGR